MAKLYDTHDHLIGQEFTKREKEIIFLVSLGKNRIECGEKLGLSPHTIKNHLQKIQKKLDLYSSVEIRTWAINRRLKQKYNTSIVELMSK